jgi:hypothetical protein
MNILNRLRRVGHDIRTGQNIDVYIAIVISVIVALLNIFSIPSQAIIFSTLLVIMALVLSSMLVNRQQNEETMAMLSNLKSTRAPAASFFYKEEHNIVEVQRAIRSSQKVILWGYTLSTPIPYLREEIEKGLDRGLQMSILLIKPSGIALEMAAFRSKTRTTKNRLNKELEDNLDHLEEIKKGRPNANFEFKVIDYFAPYTMYIYDPHLSNGKIVVKLSVFDTSGAERPTYNLTKKDDEFWFLFHLNQFEIAWKKAQLWVKGS